jgi:hypothetical protein
MKNDFYSQKIVVEVISKVLFEQELWETFIPLLFQSLSNTLVALSI